MVSPNFRAFPKYVLNCFVFYCRISLIHNSRQLYSEYQKVFMGRGIVSQDLLVYSLRVDPNMPLFCQPTSRTCFAPVLYTIIHCS